MKKKLYRCTKTGMSFIEGGLGEHWGTENSAKERCETLTTLIKEDLEVPHIISAKITLKKPLKCNDDIGKDFKVTSKYLLKTKAVTKKEINNFSSLSELRLLLQKKGYDGIEYANLEEDKGNSSYIVFSKKSIEYTNDYDDKPSFFKKLKHKIKLTKMKMTKIKKTNDGKDGGLVDLKNETPTFGNTVLAPVIVRWVDKKVEQPPKEGEYLTYNKDNDCIKVSYYDGYIWGYYATVRDILTHWAELPLPPSVG
ncbi:MAG: hypothetical protein WCI04_00280 [archaeon]